MEPYNISRNLRSIYRGDRYLRTLEREQLKTVREVNGTLENVQIRLKRRSDWLRELETAITAEETALKDLQDGLEIMLDEAMAQAAKAKIRIEKELQKLSVQHETFTNKEAETVLKKEESGEPQSGKVFVRSLDEEEPEESMESQVRVQWYHPGQSGFSSE